MLPTTRLFLAWLAISVVSVAGCKPKESAKPDSSSVITANSEVKIAHARREEAYAIFDKDMDSPGGTVGVRNACQKLLARVEAIDVSRCPDDYRELYSHQITELKSLCKVLESHPVVPPETEEEIIAGDESQKRLLDAIEKLNEACIKLREIAEKYGATVGH